MLVNVLEFDVETAALTSGYLLSGMTGAMAIMAWVGGQLTERLSYRPVTAVGLTLLRRGHGADGLALAGRHTVPEHGKLIWSFWGLALAW